jgi:hypothetical protein
MEPRKFGGKDDLGFWVGKPLQDGNPDLQMPMGGEHWQIEYGMPTNTEHRLTVEVLGDRFRDVKNWKCCSYDCVDLRTGDEVRVQGTCFKHRVK